VADSGGGLSELMRLIMQEPEMRARAKAATKVAETAWAEATRLAKERRARWITAADEAEVLRRAAPFLAEEFKAEVVVYGEEDEGRYDPAARATQAKPRRPAIFIE